jgi:hypothetical protein
MALAYAPHSAVGRGEMEALGKTGAAVAEYQKCLTAAELAEGPAVAQVVCPECSERVVARIAPSFYKNRRCLKDWGLGPAGAPPSLSVTSRLTNKCFYWYLH